MSLKDPHEARKLLKKLEEQPNKFVFGVRRAIFNCVLAMITPIARDSQLGKEHAQAHVYLLDLPGRGKTAVLNYLSAAVKAKLGRIDGRPDLMPSDLTGYEYLDRHSGARTLLKGPLHSNIFFFDEINRTPPKGQAVMLGAMEGSQVTMYMTEKETKQLDAKAFPLYPISDDPNEKRIFFICMATANPIEFEGTYPLSEAQKERFTYSFRMGLPDRQNEMRIRPWNVAKERVETVMDLTTLLDIQEMVRQVQFSDAADEYVMRLLENSRPYSHDFQEFGQTLPRKATGHLVQFVDKYVASGCSPRRNYHLIGAAQAMAFMNNKERVAVEHVKAIAPITMEHVILLQPRAEGDGVSAKAVVQKIIDETVVPV